MIQDLVMWLKSLIEIIGYPGVVLAMFIESFFAPIPSEVIMPFAGFLASEGKMNIIILGFTGGVASYLGTLPFYFMGKIGNREVINNFIEKWGRYLFIQQEEIDKAFDMFERFGYPLVFFGRLIPIIRSFISFPAGMVKMNFIKFTVYTIIGSTIWSFILTIAGYLLGNNWKEVSTIIGRYEKVMLLALFIGGIYFLWQTVAKNLIKKIK